MSHVPSNEQPGCSLHISAGLKGSYNFPKPKGNSTAGGSDGTPPGTQMQNALDKAVQKLEVWFDFIVCGDFSVGIILELIVMFGQDVAFGRDASTFPNACC